MDKNKTRLLHLLSVLQQTDEIHPLTARQIAQRMYLRGVEITPNTIRSDIATLRDMGYDLPVHSNKQNGYYLFSHTLEDYELKMLCDMVADAPYITARDSERLVAKLKTLGSPSAQAMVQRTLCVDAARKTGNTQAKLALDACIRAICARRKLAFFYTEENGVLRKRKEGAHAKEDRRYIVSPYHLAYQSQTYYLLCIPDGHDTLACFRADRIVYPSVMAETAVCSENAQPCDVVALRGYLRRAVNMYNGTPVRLRLRFVKEAQGAMFRQFGRDIPLRQDEGGALLTDVTCNEGDGMYRWLMGHADEIAVLAPARVREAMAERLACAAKAYLPPEGHAAE